MRPSETALLDRRTGSETGVLDRRGGSGAFAHSDRLESDSLQHPMLTEPHITSLLVRLLRGMSPRWADQGLRIQETQAFDGAPGASPDLLVHPLRLPALPGRVVLRGGAVW